jgi:predicted RNase H-like HicB family nuclease
MDVFSEVIVEAKIPIVVERGETGFGAFAPSVPGVVAAGDTQDQVMRRMRKALSLYFEEVHAQAAPVELAEARAAVEAARKNVAGGVHATVSMP